MSETTGLLSFRRRPQPGKRFFGAAQENSAESFSLPATASYNAFLASIPVYIEICTCVLLVINSSFAFLEVNIAYSLPIFTWVILISIQSIFLTFVVGSLHGQIAALLTRPNTESTLALLRQQVGRVSSSWVLSLFANAQILRLYLSVPGGAPLNTLDGGFDGATVPTFPEIALLIALILQIGASCLYIAEASITAFEVAFSVSAQIAGVSLYKAGSVLRK